MRQAPAAADLSELPGRRLALVISANTRKLVERRAKHQEWLRDSTSMRIFLDEGTVSRAADANDPTHLVLQPAHMLKTHFADLTIVSDLAQAAQRGYRHVAVIDLREDLQQDAGVPFGPLPPLQVRWQGTLAFIRTTPTPVLLRELRAERSAACGGGYGAAHTNAANECGARTRNHMFDSLRDQLAQALLSR